MELSMEQPTTPTNLIVISEFADSTPIGPGKMSIPSVVRKMGKEKSKIDKIKSVFADLYPDPLDSPIWNRKTQKPNTIDIPMEVSEQDIKIFEVKSPEIDENTVMEDLQQGLVKVDLTVETNIGQTQTITSCIRTDWLGTSQFHTEHLIKLQSSGNLDPLIQYREALVHDLNLTPYDAMLYIQLSMADSKLGFCDIAVGHARQAMIIIETALNKNADTISLLPELRTLVQNFHDFKYPKFGALVLEEHMAYLHRQAYQALLIGLLGAAAFWDGLVEAKAARELYPHDGDIAELQVDLKEGFMDRCALFKGTETEIEKSDMVERTRTGRIYQKKYPWMDQQLYKRTTQTMREVNKSFPSNLCEVRAVAFGETKLKVAAEGEDIGPLGIFARCDISEGEKILVDRSITGVSDIPSSSLQHCDACHGCVVAPYGHRQRVVRPSCCTSVIYCSRECYQLASNGYHQILCGKDFDWVYNGLATLKGPGAGSRWKAVLFLRVIAIILTDSRKSNTDATQHPLQHHLIARMTANYLPEGKLATLNDSSHEWHYFENVIAPTKILLQLGIDVFRDSFWTPETIQTIYWRMENNANMATTNLCGYDVRMINLNINYLFLNHSCDPNLSWHGACPSGEVGLDWLTTPEGTILQPGCSAVWCVASRDIKKDEELKISYVGNPTGDDGDKDVRAKERRESKRSRLHKWFENGCGCHICEKENQEERELHERLRVEEERFAASQIRLSVKTMNKEESTS